MSTSLLACQEVRTGLAGRLADYLELTRPRIAVLELLAVAVAAFVARWGAPDGWVVLHALVGTALVAASASALNQWLELDTDAMMPRTADRPLPAGRLSAREVLVFGGVTAAAGLAYLAIQVNLATGWIAAATWGLYVWVYTPLKRRTWLNTVVGAVAGAMPVLIGWAAVEGQFDLAAATLFLIVFLWQFPHFMAIAWIYREDYAAAGLQMLPVVDPSGRRAGRQAVWSAMALVPVSLLPVAVSFAGPGYVAWAALLSLAQLASAVVFLVWMSQRSARLLLRASLVYLPLLLLGLLLVPLI